MYNHYFQHEQYPTEKTENYVKGVYRMTHVKVVRSFMHLKRSKQIIKSKLEKMKVYRPVSKRTHEIDI